MRRSRGPHAPRISRREILQAASGLVLAGCAPKATPRSAVGSAGIPELRWGVQSGSVDTSSGVVWCRSDRPSRMFVEWSTDASFAGARAVAGPAASEDSDFIGKLRLDGLPSGERIFYRARFDGSVWLPGSFTTAPRDARNVLLAWSGDTNGQGWGIDPARGGMPAYAALAARRPDLFLHLGDTIYADNPIPATLATDDGAVWHNLTDPAKDHVAETLADFRGNHRYPRMSAEVQAASAVIPIETIWDDHEVHDNWFPGEVLVDERYVHEKNVSVLSRFARQAFTDYQPTLRSANEDMYRVVSWGPLVDIFMVDGRQHRSPNEPAPASGGLLGGEQAVWLASRLATSRAIWKIVACDMPISLVVAGYGRKVRYAYDGWANVNGEPRERETELAFLLSELKKRRVKNVVWITADVHYAAVHRLDPSRAAFKDFDPFYELVAGPMHASAFPQKPLDDTFGPEVVWSSSDPNTFGSPYDGKQFFGLLGIDGKTHALDVTFVDARGRDVHRLAIAPASI